MERLYPKLYINLPGKKQEKPLIIKRRDRYRIVLLMNHKMRNEMATIIIRVHHPPSRELLSVYGQSGRFLFKNF